MVPWSTVTVGGKSINDVIKDHQKEFEGIFLDTLVQKTVRQGGEIVSRKGATDFGIASAVAGIIQTILNDENRIVSVSTLLQGQYGVNNIFAGVPCILNRNGVQDVVELHLLPEELEKFHNSCNVLSQYTKSLMELDATFNQQQA